MRLIFGIVGGLIGAVAGAAIWAAIAFYAHVESGWVAWGVGLLAGLGVGLGTKFEEGWMGGGIAVVLALLGIAGGKYAAVHFEVERIAAKSVAKATDLDVVEGYAAKIAADAEAKGKKITWPTKVDPDLRAREDYPKDVWAQAAKQWEALPQANKDYEIAMVQQARDVAVGAMKSQITQDVFAKSFGLWDILFIGLAGFSAFKLASGMSSDD